MVIHLLAYVQLMTTTHTKICNKHKYRQIQTDISWLFIRANKNFIQCLFWQVYFIMILMSAEMRNSLSGMSEHYTRKREKHIYIYIKIQVSILQQFPVFPYFGQNIGEVEMKMLPSSPNTMGQGLSQSNEILRNEHQLIRVYQMLLATCNECLIQRYLPL